MKSLIGLELQMSDDDLRSERIAELEKSRRRWLREAAESDQIAAMHRDALLEGSNPRANAGCYAAYSDNADAAGAYAMRVVDRIKRLERRRK